MKRTCACWLLVIGLLAPLAGFAAAGKSDGYCGKTEVEMKAPLGTWSFDLKEVRLIEGSPFYRAMQLDMKYLKDLEPDRMLLHIYENAGLEPKSTEKYGGWSGSTLTGHYLSACSQMYASTGDEELKRRIDYIVDELAGIQKKTDSGFIGCVKPASRLIENLFTADEIKAGKWDVNDCGNFFYGEHKTFAGLIDAYVQADNRKALEVVTKFADWYIKQMAPMSEENFQKMLATEHGGMLESMAQLYGLTGEKKYLDFALRFEHHRDMDPLANEEDDFTGLHVNTTIPKVIGAARIYELTGDERYRTIAEYFWKRVVETRIFVTGGIDFHEHFKEPGTESEFLSWDSCETCCVYNMLKLTRMLFSWDPQPKYMNYYEQSLYNQILGSQDPETGGFTYYYSLQPGGFKVYGSRYDSMWCCVKTGLENHAKYGDTIYFHKDDAIWVNLFIPSELEWSDMGAVFRQETAFPEEGVMRFTVEMQEPREWTLNLRVPEWGGEGVSLLVNGEEPNLTGASPTTYLALRREWNDGDTVEYRVPMSLYLRESRDDEDKVTVMYGPLALAGTLGKQGMPNPIAQGNHKKFSSEMPGMVPTLVLESRDPSDWLEPVPGESLAFRTRGVANPEDVTLIPIHQLHRERQTVYWEVMTPEECSAFSTPESAEEVKKEALKPGLAYAYYEGTWKNLPDFDELAPDRKGVLPGFVIDEERLERTKDNFALRFTGFLELSEPGAYVFGAKSDDGSRIILGGLTLVDNDGIHAEAAATSRAVDLKAGLYPLEVQFFEGAGGETLQVLWLKSGEEAKWSPIPEDALFHAE